MLKTLITNPQARSDVDALTETATRVLDFVDEHGVDALSFSGLKPQEIHPEHLAVALRVTSRFKDEVEGWGEALGVAREAAVLANIDPEDVLYGMI